VTLIFLKLRFQHFFSLSLKLIVETELESFILVGNFSSSFFILII
jgi:hypothetical protein